MDNKIYLIALNKLFFGYPRELSLLLLESSDPLPIWENVDEHLLKTPIKDKFQKKQKDELLDFAKKEVDAISKLNVEIIPIYNEKYPKLLKDIYDPPAILFINGTIPEHFKSISIVGSREYTEYGEKVTKMLAKELANVGITVVSGLANGIDSIAMDSAIKANGKTIGIIGSGIDVIYPRTSRYLFLLTKNNGAVITEFFLKTPPNKWNFPRRNRIISGISKGTVIVEANLASGSLITAYLALNQGREVFAVPGNIFSKSSAGTHSLIKKGAKLVTSIDDILEEIFQEINQPKKKNVKKDFLHELNEDEKVIYNILINEPSHIDIITLKSGFDIGRLSHILITLEMRGIIQEKHGKIFEVL